MSTSLNTGRQNTSNSFMLWRFYAKRFPNASKFEKRRKLGALALYVLAAIGLIAAIALGIVHFSGSTLQ